MKRMLIYALLCITIFYFDGFACSIDQGQSFIKKIFSFKSAEESLKKADKDTLVLFDVDDTLIVHRYKPLWQKNKEWLAKATSNIFPTPEESRRSLRILRQSSIPSLIESDIVQCISDLQKRGVPVFALTAIHSFMRQGRYVEPEWRYEKLKACGIDFTHTDFPDYIFTTFSTNTLQSKPHLFRGILCTCLEPKGKVTGALLDKFCFQPKKIIVFEDRFENLENVKQEVAIRNVGRSDKIAYEGYHYLGAEIMDPSFDEELANFQLGYLAATDIWLDEVDAKKLLEKMSSGEQDDFELDELAESLNNTSVV